MKKICLKKYKIRKKIKMKKIHFQTGKNIALSGRPSHMGSPWWCPVNKPSDSEGGLVLLSIYTL